jgi:hypothetical protein
MSKAVFLFVCAISSSYGLPSYLDCGMLSASPTIMGFPKLNTSIVDAPFVLTPLKAPSLSKWQNYSINFTPDAGIVIQSADNMTQLDNYGNGLCGNDPKYLGRGLCQKCTAQLFAADFDCTGAMECVFGVKKDGKPKQLLIGYGHGVQVQVTYVTV